MRSSVLFWSRCTAWRARGAIAHRTCERESAERSAVLAVLDATNWWTPGADLQPPFTTACGLATSASIRTGFPLSPLGA
jgi:hypothetical protein